MPYGIQPTGYKRLWSRMHTIIKAVAPDTVLVWAPNTGYGYPFGMSLSHAKLSADRLALDTNGDGKLSSKDDPYAPYYPGDDLVDWIGNSVCECLDSLCIALDLLSGP